MSVKTHISEAWEETVRRVRDAKTIKEIAEEWKWLHDLLTAYADEANERYKLHTTHSLRVRSYTAYEVLRWLARNSRSWTQAGALVIQWIRKIRRDHGEPLLCIACGYAITDTGCIDAGKGLGGERVKMCTRCAIKSAAERLELYIHTADDNELLSVIRLLSELLGNH